MYIYVIGWTGERIAWVGDSAGGNLIMSVAIRCITLNIKRMPDGNSSMIRINKRVCE
jgi:hypothetical protein